MRAQERFVFGLVVTVILAGFVVLSIRYLPQARLAPITIGLPTLGLMLVQMWQIWYSRMPAPATESLPAGDAEANADPGAEQRRVDPAKGVTLATELPIIGWIAGFVALIWLLGFTVAVPVFLFLMVRTRFHESVAVSAGLSLAVWVGLYIAFDVFLKVPMNCGVLLGLQ